jgi:hypothetical protein
VSVEAISLALNLAPADRGGQPSSACKFVLVGLANHAGPHGTAALPSVATLVRYTGLSERTVRTCPPRSAPEDPRSPGSQRRSKQVAESERVTISQSFEVAGRRLSTRAGVLREPGAAGLGVRPRRRGCGTPGSPQRSA